MRVVILNLRKHLPVIILLLIFSLLVTVSALTGAASVYTGNVERKLPIYCVETEEPKIAISFDATWGADKTEKILEILNQHDAKATFFLVGFWAEKYSDMVRKIDESGMEIGTHSNTHPDMSKLSPNAIELELITSMNILENITGKRPKYFRPPYGAYNNKLIEKANELGLMTIQWDVDSLDWKAGSAHDIAMRVINKTKKGSIILMHNNGDNTVEALKLIVPGLKNKGYQFVTVGELVYDKDYVIDHTGKQIKKN